MNFPISPVTYRASFRPPRFVRTYRFVGQPVPPSTTEEENRRMRLQRAAHFGVFIAGILVSVIAFPYRSKPIGAIALGAGSSTVGIALTFLVMDLLGNATSKPV